MPQAGEGNKIPKLRIANYYVSNLGRNDGNPLYMWHAFGSHPSQLIESGHLMPNGDWLPFGEWDLNFEADWAEDALKGVLPFTPVDIPHPNAFWASDTHLGYEWRLEHSRKFDYVFCCQKRAVEEFKRDGIPNPIWLPHAFEPMAYFLEPSVKKYDVCFVGHINSENRIEALERLFREFPNFFYGQRVFEMASEVYSQSKIIFNISIKDDVNMRLFEALGSGSFLLTNDVPTIHDLFEDGKHLVTYRDVDDMIEKARYYIEHDDEREAIAKAGYEEAISKHTFTHRVDTILEVTGLMDKIKEPVA